ncbi:MAG: FkbM family methyltransferase [Cyclobacteriaceae bacterium]|jgi:FkbM family methyltransferase|nr:FkbM family methyltransferase [Cyclobacteriaceae bacterium]
MKFLKRSLIKLVAKLDGPIFIHLVNLLYQLNGLICRLKVENGNYYIVEDEIKIQLASKVRYSRYLKGVKNTLDSLAKNYFLDKIKFEQHNVFVDCGANVGELGIWLKQKYHELIYIGFEPSSSEFKALSQNLSGNSLYNLALWSSNESLKFYLSIDTADSSLIQPSDYTDIISISAVRLDTVISNVNRIKVLKVEAEGAEPEVLEGAYSLIDICDYIVVDTSPERGVKKDETTVHVIDYMYQRGFKLLEILHRPRIMCLFVNGSLSK